ncbi:MAG: PfkB family carbohydrate kinase [Pseudomonadota bacterium]
MTRIAVFGEMLLDQFASGPVVGGAPFNVARHLAAFGHAPLMVSAVGTDAHAQTVLAEMDRYAMDRAGVQVTPDHATGLVDVAMQANGSHQFSIRSNSAWDFIDTRRALAATAALEPTGYLYAGSLALRSAVSRATGLALMQSHAGPVYLDLNWREGHVTQEIALQAIGLADTLKVNDDEFLMLCQWLGIAATEGLPQHNNVRQLLRQLPLNLLLVTCGSEGALAFDGEGRCIAQGSNTRAIQLVDTVGAGDAFSAVVLAGLLRAWDMETTLQRANTFSGHICETRGAVPVELAAYHQWTADWQ